MLWSVALLRSDRLVALVQLTAWAVTAIGVYGLARRVCFGRQAATLAAGGFAMLPEAVLESTSTLNDLVLTSFVVCCTYFLISAARARNPVVELAFAGAAAGLAVGTKGIAVLALPVIAPLFVVLRGVSINRAIVGGTLLGGGLGLLLGGFMYAQ